MRKRKYNYLGEDITEVKRKLSSPSFGEYNVNGEPLPYWTPENEDVDGDGFDKHYNGTHGYWDEITLDKGKLLVRYGNERGYMTTDYGTPYELLGLPYVPETVEYHVYEVIADNVVVKCQVKKGIVSPMFNSEGGAIQYKHSQSIFAEIADGKLKEV